MKVQVVGVDGDGFLDKVRKLGLEPVADHADVIVAYGGDGTFIGSERRYPGVPKIGIRRDSTCRKCERHRDEVVLERLRRGELERRHLIKLEARWSGGTALALNDVILRNHDARTAVRFRVSLGGHTVTEEMIGDGLVVCTPFGSSAYFRSITRTVLRVGIGVAFNNCTDPLHHMVIGEDEEVEVELTRGPAALAADNDSATPVLDSGDRLVVRSAAAPAVVLAPDTLRCAECRYVNAPRRRY